MTRTLTWASYNKPTSITSGSTTETFVYGPSRERLQTTVTGTSGTVTTTYIDGLFEQVQDSAGNITYKHYILAGSARVGVETVAVTSGGTTDTLSFFVQDQVGSVVAEVTEGLGGLNQQLTVYSHDPWGKARPTRGIGANLALLPGIFQANSAIMAGQHEGFAGHEDLVYPGTSFNAAITAVPVSTPTRISFATWIIWIRWRACMAVPSMLTRFDQVDDAT